MQSAVNAMLLNRSLAVKYLHNETCAFSKHHNHPGRKECIVLQTVGISRFYFIHFNKEACLTINNILVQTSCLPSEHLEQRAGIQARGEEEGDPRAFQFLLHHMKSFVINKSVVYALYMAVCASKHTHTHTRRDPLEHSHICRRGYYYCEFIASGHLIVPFDNMSSFAITKRQQEPSLTPLNSTKLVPDPQQGGLQPRWHCFTASKV